MATDPNTVRSYDANAAEYHAHVSEPTDSPYHAYYEKPAIRAELPALDGLDVLSIGCGSGVDTRWLAANGAASVTGVDISAKLLDIARRDNPDIDFRQMDMEQLDFPDESFDLLYSSLAIHYVDDWTQSLKEARRVLRPGGQYIFSCGHPIDSAMEYETKDGIATKRLGRTVNRTANERVVHGDYLAADGEGIKAIKGMLGDIEIVVYHRTISKMIEHINAAGFKIERLVEPQPIEGDPIHYKELTKIPMFMIWVLAK